MRIFGIILCLATLALTGYSALTYKAPRIEADIERRSAEMLSVLGGDEISARADGRHVILEGEIADDELRTRIVNAAATVPGALGPIDNLVGVTVVSPYRFGAIKAVTGEVTIEGMAPTPEMRDAIETDARAIFGEEASIDIELAAGAPESDWRVTIGTAMDALATMRQGELSITDVDVVLKGDVTAQSDVEAIDIFAATMPEGVTWTHDVGLHREIAEPFTFSVVKDEDGSLRLTGFAPDEETRLALIDQGEALGGDRPVTTDIKVADGMPDEEWPTLVQAGISAMKDMAAGRFDVVDNDVSFSSDPAVDKEDGADDEADEAPVAALTSTDDDPATEEPLAATDGSVDAALVAPSNLDVVRPATVLTVDKVEEGVWSVRGVVPDDRSRNALVGVIEDRAGIEDVEVELELADGAFDDAWLRYAEDRIAALDTVQAGRLNVEDFEAHLIGVVETTDEIEPVRTALAAVDADMTVDLQPIDPRPAAFLDLTMSPDEGLIVDGALPSGITEGEAMMALGIQRYDGGIDENGRGQAEAWRQDLAKIGDHLPVFEQIDLSLGGERPRVKGRVHAGGDADGIARDLVLALGEARQPLVDVEASTVVYQDDARRTNPLTGEEEFHRNGYWLPVVDLVADEDACRARSAAMQAEDKITFLRGQENLDQRARSVLDALAALAIVCLDDTDLVLEIGGHTDSRGAARMNQELSQARADAVREALAARGVDASALIAVGYGDAEPVADNTTDEGRAANRRITFDWKTSSDLRVSGSEG